MAAVKQHFEQIIADLEYAYDTGDEARALGMQRYFAGLEPSLLIGILNQNDAEYVESNKTFFTEEWDALIADRQEWSSDG